MSKVEKLNARIYKIEFVPIQANSFNIFSSIIKYYSFSINKTPQSSSFSVLHVLSLHSMVCLLSLVVLTAAASWAASLLLSFVEKPAHSRNLLHFPFLVYTNFHLDTPLTPKCFLTRNKTLFGVDYFGEKISAIGLFLDFL